MIYNQEKKRKKPNCLKLLLFVLGVIFVGNTFSQEVTFLERSQVTDDALYFWYPNGKKAFHYAPSISPRGDCFTIANGYIFFGWYKGGMKNGRDLMISRKKIGSGNWVTVQLPHKNTLIGAKKEWGDSHNTISVGISKTDGTIHIFYDHHNDPLKYIVSKNDAAFVDDKDFKIGLFNKTRGYLAKGQPITITYPKITENNAGELIVNYRKGSAVGGNEMVHVYNPITHTWSKAKMILRGSGLPHVEVKDRNYAYAPSPVLAGGNIYYGFSVRWARKKPSGVLNEGLYLANTGAKMAGKFKTVDYPNPITASESPIQDYTPFLIDLPKSNNDKGSSGGPSLAVTDRGDIHMAYRGRGKGSTYNTTYVRKAGTSVFTKIEGQSKVGIAYGNRVYNTAINKNTGVITIQSTEGGAYAYTDDFVYESGDKIGATAVRIVDGNLVIIAEDRSNTKTDSQGVFCYTFKLPGQEEGDTSANNDVTGKWYKLKNVETGRYLRSIGGNNIIAASVSTGIDKEWQFIKSGNYYNIDSRTSADGSGILRATGNNIIGTRRAAPRADVDKVWSVVKTSSDSYRLELRNTGRFIYNETNDGNKLLQLNTNTGDRSKWILEEVTNAKKLGEKTKLEEEVSVKIYPNPTKGVFNISLIGANKADVLISNVLGKTVYKTTTNKETMLITTAAKFPSGMYLVKVIINDKAYYKKLIIN